MKKKNNLPQKNPKIFHKYYKQTNILNRPGVAEAVIQTSLSLIQSNLKALEYFFLAHIFVVVELLVDRRGG